MSKLDLFVETVAQICIARFRSFFVFLLTVWSESYVFASPAALPMSAKWTIWGHLGRPGPGRPNFSKSAGCQKPHKIASKIWPQIRFQASGSPGTVFEVPGERSQRRRKAILTRLSAKTAPDPAKRTRLSAKTAIGDWKHTISHETVSKSRHRESHRRRKNIGFWPDCQ